MLKTLRLSLALKNTYRVNSILYAIKQIPLIKKIIPDSIYSEGGLKVFGNVISAIWTVITTFIGKLLYFLVMIAAVSGFYNVSENAGAPLFLQLLFVLTVIGAFMNTLMFDPSKDRYYAIILLGMDARRYTIANYAFSLLRLMLGFTLAALIFGLMMGLNVWKCLLVPFFVAGMKMTFAAYELRRYEKSGSVKNDKKLAALRCIAMFLLLGIAYAPPALGYILPETVTVVLMCLTVLAGVLSLKKIITFKSYRSMYKELLNDALAVQMDGSAQAKLVKAQARNSISADSGITSSKRGFEYLNELFIKRHRKILWRSAERITLVVLVIIAAVLVLFKYVPESKVAVNGAMMNFLPFFLFVMYALNRGTGFTQALFINCDSSLLTYSFYKQPRCILKLFQIRLREIIKVNLLPAAAIGGGLALLLYASGGTDNPLNYAVLVVSTLCMSVFFSVHYLMLYYLLQPYNAGTEIKSGTYKLAMVATYIVCYVFMQLRFPTLIFGAATIAFCVIYSIAASILVYRLAPKTFKIRA
ncbi:MAG: hypothetical protein ACI4F7_09290 [Acutalibacteraceae bacterium]